MKPSRQSRGVSLPAIAAAAALLLSVGIAACGSGDDGGNPDSRLTPEQATEPLANAPPQLAAVREQANQLLDGGTEAFERRLEELRGFPVVVNKWASWCGPCRFEFPWFQSLAEKHGGEIAFLGDAGDDSADALSTFLEELPLPYPSYLDPDLKIAQELGGPVRAFPATAFYDRSGELVYTHPGVYRDEQELIADVNRYAGG
jgi:cytochrome c biogenesis protein CcmG, thiol:disulfide interchange protein DsbE